MLFRSGSYRVSRVDEYEEITLMDLEDLLKGTEFSRIKFRKSVEKGSFDSAKCVNQIE